MLHLPITFIPCALCSLENTLPGVQQDPDLAGVGRPGTFYPGGVLVVAGATARTPHVGGSNFNGVFWAGDGN